MEPNEIWDLIVKADEAVKYATEEKETVRREQAIKLLLQARDEARQIGNQNLEDQAQRRLEDLGAGEPQA